MRARPPDGRRDPRGRSSVVPRSADGDGARDRPRGTRPAETDRARGGRPGCRQHRLRFYCKTEPGPPQSPEPILIPKLRIGFADFPYLHYSMRLEAADLGDLLRISVRTDAKIHRSLSSDFQGPRGLSGHRRNERCSARSAPSRPARGFQGATTLTEKRELFPQTPAASPISFRSPGRDKKPRTLGSGSASGSGIRTGFPLAPRPIRKRLRP